MLPWDINLSSTNCYVETNQSFFSTTKKASVHPGHKFRESVNFLDHCCYGCRVLRPAELRLSDRLIFVGGKYSLRSWNNRVSTLRWIEQVMPLRGCPSWHAFPSFNRGSSEELSWFTETATVQSKFANLPQPILNQNHGLRGAWEIEEFCELDLGMRLS